MNDLISRQAAIDAVRSYYDEFDISDKSIEERIEALPSAQIDQLWIPVSERQPGEQQTVIASINTGIYPEARFVDGIWWWAYEAGTNYWEEIKQEVTAWMPLPKPYRKGANPP